MPAHITIRELREYWDHFDSLEEGQSTGRYVYTSEMPPWQDICAYLRWRTYRVDGGYFSREHHGFCGVYRLVALASEKDIAPAAVIDRLGGKDASGTLYIGKAGWLHERLNQLRRSLKLEDTHGAGRMWRESQVISSKFPYNRLGISFMTTSGAMRSLIESDLIRAYLNSFGDTPPLNCSF